MNTIQDLREQLFKALTDLREKKIDHGTAKAISQLAQVVINSAKVEVEFMRVSKTRGTGFIEPFVPGTPARPRIVNGRSQSGSADD